VLAPAVLGALGVWIQNQKKKSSSKGLSFLWRHIWRTRFHTRGGWNRQIHSPIIHIHPSPTKLTQIHPHFISSPISHPSSQFNSEGALGYVIWARICFTPSFVTAVAVILAFREPSPTSVQLESDYRSYRGEPLFFLYWIALLIINSLWFWSTSSLGSCQERMCTKLLSKLMCAVEEAILTDTRNGLLGFACMQSQM